MTRYRINQVKLDVGEDHEALADAIRRKLKKPSLDISELEIVKESVDARRKPDVKLIYTVDFSCPQKLRLDKAEKRDYDGLEKEIPKDDSRERPVVVGFGPCGMFGNHPGGSRPTSYRHRKRSACRRTRQDSGAVLAGGNSG